MKRLGMTYYDPNYVYFDSFDRSSVVVDVGCGYEAEFSRHMIARHGLKAYGVDPTRKHVPFLAKLVASSGGRFIHLPFAVAREGRVLTFHESRENESGSLLAEHTNVRRDETTSYEVEAVSLAQLKSRIDADEIAFLKLDLEGAEYDLLRDVSSSDLTSIDQLFVEFHHHCTDHTIAETNAIVARIAAIGFDVFTLDRHNFLFSRPRTARSARSVGRP